MCEFISLFSTKKDNDSKKQANLGAQLKLAPHHKYRDYPKGSEAKSSFDSAPKQDVILLANWGAITSCKIKNISNITSEMIDLLDDVILTDCNFEWAYGAKRLHVLINEII